MSETCSGAPTACTCVPDNASACFNKACGTVKNNCGADVSCGTCTLPETCGGAVQYQCGCTAEPLATTCASKVCGPATNNCGQKVWCPNTCSDLKTCDANNACVDPPSCVGLGAGQATCGDNGDSCCRNTLVPGGAFNRRNSASYPATVSDFRLDRYEVTVKRYAAFKYAWVTQGYRPAAGSGKHRHLPGGLNGNETGWDPTWVTDSVMAITSADFDSFLACGPKATWGSAGDLAINCVSWWEASAFCIWDGGFLPSSAEWGYASAGGAEQRTYPWASNYNGGSSWANACINVNTCGDGAVTTVGHTNYGVGKWSQWDLAGNVAELSADRPASGSSTPPIPCVDCADMTSAVGRVAHGGSWRTYYNFTYSKTETPVTTRSDEIGFRCARLP